MRRKPSVNRYCQNDTPLKYRATMERELSHRIHLDLEGHAILPGYGNSPARKKLATRMLVQKRSHLQQAILRMAS
jgi:hypothetical protein